MKTSPEAKRQTEKISVWDMVPESSRPLIRELLGPYPSEKDLATATPEDYALLEQHGPRLLEAKQLGLIGILFRIKNLTSLATMEQAQFENLKNLAIRFPQGKIYHLVDRPEYIKAMETTDPRSKAIEALLEVMDAGFATIAIKNPEIMDRILAAPSPKEWVNERIIIQDRFQTLCKRESFNEWIFLTADERLLVKFEELDDTPLRRIAAERWYSLEFDDEEKMDDLLSLWRKMLTPEFEATLADGEKKSGTT